MVCCMSRKMENSQVPTEIRGSSLLLLSSLLQLSFKHGGWCQTVRRFVQPFDYAVNRWSGERVFLSCLGASKPVKQHTQALAREKHLQARITVQLTPCYKFEAAGCKQIKIACQCKLLLGLEVCLVDFFVLCFCSCMQQSHLSFLFSSSSLGPQTDTRCRKRTLCQICCQQVDSDSVYSLRPLWTLHYFPNEADC